MNRKSITTFDVLNYPSQMVHLGLTGQFELQQEFASDDKIDLPDTRTASISRF